MAVDDYDTTPGNNTTISGINIAEGCSPGGINNAIRQMMADIASWDAVVPRLDGTETISGAWTFSTLPTFAGFNCTGNAKIDKAVPKFTMTNSADATYPDSAGRLVFNSDGFTLQARLTSADTDGTIGLSGYNGDDLGTLRRRRAGDWHNILDQGECDARYPNIESGAGAPSSTPGKVGDKYVDTTNNELYFAVGTSSSADWAGTAQGLGIGQTWQDVTGSRSAATSYQNTTGKPIQVNFRWDSTNFSDMAQVSTDNSTWVDVVGSSGGTRISGSFVVPDQHYYRIAGTIDTWSELR